MKAGSSIAQKIAQRQKRQARFHCRMWHIAPAMYRETIRRDGLRCALWGKSCRVYFWDSLKAACFFAAEYRGDGIDVWEVDVVGIPLYVDDETCDMSQWAPSWREGESGHGFYARQSIPANRVRGPVDLACEKWWERQ